MREEVRVPRLVPFFETRAEYAEEIQRKRDEFLDVYSLYLRTRISWVRDELRLKAYQLRILDPAFSFQI